ncbi:MAG: hypothetical protein WDW38_004682 [Sanguina aurantia]
MAASPHAPPWSRSLEAASDIINKLLTPFFVNTTRAIAAGVPPALLSCPQETMTTLSLSMPRFMGLLSESTAWHQAGSGPALTSQWVVRLLNQQRLMINACFDSTNAVLDGRHNPSPTDIHPRYLTLLSTAFNVIQSWNPIWPSEHLLGNAQALVNLDRLVGRVLRLSRDLASLGSHVPEGERLIESTVTGSHPRWRPSPPTLLPNMLTLVDEQLAPLIRGTYASNFNCIADIAISLSRFTGILAQRGLPTCPLLTPQLVGFAKHVLVMCVAGTLPAPYDGERISPGEDGPPVHGSRGSGQGPVARPPTVSQSEYVRALCLCSSTCGVYGAAGNCLYANNLLQLMLDSWRTGRDIIFGDPQLVCLLSLLRFLGRQAQLRIQTPSRLRQRAQKLEFQDQFMIKGDNLQVQIVLLDTCLILAAFTGLGIPANPGIDAPQASLHPRLLPLSRPLLALKKHVLWWACHPGSAATVEALLRDKHLRDPYIEQHTAARIALMMLDAPHDSSHGAIRSRISLAATLRKLMHPATAAVWEQASDLGSCKVWGPASKCSRAATEQCLAVIHQLNTTVTVTLRHVPCFSAEVRKQLASAGATIKGTANDTAGGSNGSKAGLRTAPKFASSSSQLESEGKIHHMHQQQLLVILAATQNSKGIFAQAGDVN